MLTLNKTVKINQNIHIKAPDCTNKQGANEHYDENKWNILTENERNAILKVQWKVSFQH